MNEILDKKEHQKNLSLFLQRYPKYSLFFSRIEEEFELVFKDDALNAKHIQEGFFLYDFPINRFSSWQKNLDLDDREVLCVYGLGLGYSYDFLKKWIHKKRERDLIFVEDETLLPLFLKTSNSREMLNDPQVHFYFKMKDADETAFLDEIAIEFPFQRMAIVPSLEKKEAPFINFKEKFLRSNVYFSALQIEELYSCRQFENFLSNLKRIPSSFFLNSLKNKFKNIPALICGAGPSLYEEKEEILKMYDKAFIIAGGSAITALSSYGLQAHMGVIIDPNEEEFLRLRKSRLLEMPIIYTTRSQSKVFDTFNGPLGYFKSSFVGEHHEYAEKELNIDAENFQFHSREAFSVTTENIALAHFLGCSPIILCGVDLAYSDNLRYGPGVSDKNEVVADNDPGNLTFEKEDRFGKKVLTCMRWAMESDYISSYAKTYNIEIINATSKGIGFKDIKYTALSDVEKKLKPIDLSGYFHALSFQEYFDISHERVEKLIRELKKSLSFCKKCTNAIVKELKVLKKENKKLETPLMIVSKYELEKEIAYQCLLKSSKRALDKQIAKYHKPWNKALTKKDHIKMSYDLWHNFSRMIDQYLNNSFF